MGRRSACAAVGHDVKMTHIKEILKPKRKAAKRKAARARARRRAMVQAEVDKARAEREAAEWAAIKPGDVAAWLVCGHVACHERGASV